MASGQTHETSAHNDEIKMGSERSFGIVFGVVFLIIALLPLWKGADIRLWALAVGAVFGVLAFIYPSILRPLNILWFKFGLLLGKIMTPIVMGILFFGTFLPMGLIVRGLMKKDLLRLKLEPDSDSYWIKRDPPGPDPSTMKQQF